MTLDDERASHVPFKVSHCYKETLARALGRGETASPPRFDANDRRVHVTFSEAHAGWADNCGSENRRRNPLAGCPERALRNEIKNRK